MTTIGIGSLLWYLSGLFRMWARKAKKSVVVRFMPLESAMVMTNWSRSAGVSGVLLLVMNGTFAILTSVVGSGVTWGLGRAWACCCCGSG